MSLDPNEMLNDWRPEIRALLRRLLKAGFKLTGAHNGEDGYEGSNVPKLIECLDACDEANLYVEAPGGEKHRLFLVLGNSPGEIVCDYSITSYETQTDGDKLLDAVTSAHYEEWDGRKQPKIRQADKYFPRAGIGENPLTKSAESGTARGSGREPNRKESNRMN